jgi:uncharacterized membrane protein YtjA (UPF0391 family)
MTSSIGLSSGKTTKRRCVMLHWALAFLLLALVAGFLGFGGIALVSIEVARLLFGVFLILFLLAAVVHVMHGRAPPV